MPPVDLLNTVIQTTLTILSFLLFVGARLERIPRVLDQLKEVEMWVVGNLSPPQSVIKRIERLLGESKAETKVLPFHIRAEVPIDLVVNRTDEL